MDEKKELEGLKVGDKGWSPLYGEFEVTDADDEEGLQIAWFGTSGIKETWWVITDGRRYTVDKHPAFFRNEESFRRYWELEYTGDGDDSKAPPKEEFSIDPEIVKDLMDATDSIQEEVQKMMIAAKAFRCAGEHLTGDLVDEFSHTVDSHRNNSETTTRGGQR